MGFGRWITEKLNPAQSYLSGGGSQEEASREPTISYQLCYEKLEVVNRAVNMLVDDVSCINYVVGDPLSLNSFAKGVRKVQLDRLLNFEPNPFQDISSFRRALILDYIIDGNMFVYWDGSALYHLPATRMKVVADKDTFISHYEFDGGAIKYQPEEIVHIKDNNYQTIYRGASRLKPALRTMQSLLDMRAFQDNFFKNGAVPGLTLSTDERLNDRHKEKLLQEWQARYRPTTGGKRPVILDGGLKVEPISTVNFQELDFQNSISTQEGIILKALGIPPLLLDAGNNANIRPNHRLYYLETVMPIVNKITAGYKRMFGFDVYEDTTYVEALRPELKEEAAYYQSLVNAGIMAANEARDKLGLPKLEGHDDLRIPANIAGSAADPSQGGKPPQGEE
jgi:HK97 family phage portal protein